MNKSQIRIFFRPVGRHYYKFPCWWWEQYIKDPLFIDSVKQLLL